MPESMLFRFYADFFFLPIAARAIAKSAGVTRIAIPKRTNSQKFEANDQELRITSVALGNPESVGAFRSRPAALADTAEDTIATAAAVVATAFLLSFLNTIVPPFEFYLFSRRRHPSNPNLPNLQTFLFGKRP
ncbi:hypothetical protein, partial [Rhodococcus rhodochrous]|uniref:hypothetical protein n=1 Tax=Rhodococcus rhodochrous TaxID=1829 RepID=UPI0012FE739F